MLTSSEMFPRFGFRTAVRDTKSSRLRAASLRALHCPGCLHRCQKISTIHRSAARTDRICWPCTDTWTVSVVRDDCDTHENDILHFFKCFNFTIFNNIFPYILTPLSTSVCDCVLNQDSKVLFVTLYNNTMQLSTFTQVLHLSRNLSYLYFTLVFLFHWLYTSVAQHFRLKYYIFNSTTFIWQL